MARAVDVDPPIMAERVVTRPASVHRSAFTFSGTRGFRFGFFSAGPASTFLVMYAEGTGERTSKRMDGPLAGRSTHRPTDRPTGRGLDDD